VSAAPRPPGQAQALFPGGKIAQFWWGWTPPGPLHGPPCQAGRGLGRGPKKSHGGPCPRKKKNRPVPPARGPLKGRPPPKNPKPPPSKPCFFGPKTPTGPKNAGGVPPPTPRGGPFEKPSGRVGGRTRGPRPGRNGGGAPAGPPQAFFPPTPAPPKAARENPRWKMSTPSGALFFPPTGEQTFEATLGKNAAF